MRYLVIIVGLLVGTVAQAQNPDFDVYQELRAQVERELIEAHTEVQVRWQMTHAEYGAEEKIELEESDIEPALHGQTSKVCDPGSITGSQPEELVPSKTCSDLLIKTKRLAKRQKWLRRTVRDLQLSATNYELGLQEYIKSPANLIRRLPSIAAIWSSDSDVLPQSSAPSSEVRYEDYDTGMEEYFVEVRRALEDLIDDHSADEPNRERMNAAVWRYQHGFTAIAADTCDNANLGDGTPLQFTTARYCDIESALQVIMDTVGRPSDMPIVFPAKEFTDLNVYVWVRNNEAGLGWLYPIEPVLPSLNCDPQFSYDQPQDICVDGIVLGGEYPPEQDHGDFTTGLCSHPFAKRGYLCRNQSVPHCPSDNEPRTDPDKIELVSCNPTQADATPINYNESSENVCQRGGWREPVDGIYSTLGGPGEDDDPRLNSCTPCYVDIVCKPSCPNGFAGFAEKKERDGRIEVCIDESPIPALGVLPKYILIHEISHARDICHLPPGEDIFSHGISKGCCANEYQPSLVECQALANDNVLNAIGMTVDECARAFAADSCNGVAICFGQDLNDAVEKILMITTYLNDHIDELDLPESCEELVNDMSPESEKALYSLPYSCSPDCPQNYRNTIGNNLCALGQCIEESLEENRIIPGQAPFVGGGEAFPYDSEAREPASGSVLLATTHTYTNLPAYRPRLLITKLETQLCQLSGRPLLIPPTLCAADPNRRLGLLSKGLWHLAEGIASGQANTANAIASFNRAAPNITARMGTRMYAQYYQSSLPRFEQFLKNANILLRQFEDVEFTNQLCPDLPPDA